MNQIYYLYFKPLAKRLIVLLIVFIFLANYMPSTASASNLSPRPRVSITSPTWGFNEGSNFMQINATIMAAGNSSIVGHSVEFIPYVCSTEDIADICELDLLSAITYTFQNPSETNNFTFTIPGYYRNANFIYFFVYDTVTGNGSFAGDGVGNFDHHFINYTGSRLPVYRIYNHKQGAHFYTMNYLERKSLLSAHADMYDDEGVAYFSDTYKYDNNLPVHRFYNFKQGVHFYTINQAEATNVNNNLYNTYKYEGVAYYAFN